MLALAQRISKPSQRRCVMVLASGSCSLVAGGLWWCEGETG
ncbi:hypothetical protein BVRB_7g163280 [Beta vulgaris subsp. vulgaris]|nr:hypothetical protein BVRB_7g163280 [Beta vulgaris subsp. vulgaris]